MSKTFAIYLPAYNAALTLPKVLDRIPEELKRKAAKILIVDNHSTDDTQAVALRYKSQNQLTNMEVIRNARNLGYGGSQKVAYAFCVDNGIDIVAMVHADGQYAPEILGEMMEPIMTEKADMVFGSRISGHPLKGGMPLHRFLGNRVLTTFQNLFLGSRLSEFHSGYRIFSVPGLARLNFVKLSDDYHFDTEMIILHLRAGLRIVERPIPTHYGDEKNYVNIWATELTLWSPPSRTGFIVTAFVIQKTGRAFSVEAKNLEPFVGQNSFSVGENEFGFAALGREALILRKEHKNLSARVRSLKFGELGLAPRACVFKYIFGLFEVRIPQFAVPSNIEHRSLCLSHPSEGQGVALDEHKGVGDFAG